MIYAKRLIEHFQRFVEQLVIFDYIWVLLVDFEVQFGIIFSIFATLFIK